MSLTILPSPLLVPLAPWPPSHTLSFGTAESQAWLKTSASARREEGSSLLTLAAHLCHSFSSSCLASSVWGPLLHLQSRRGVRCGSHVLCPCCSSLFSASKGIFGQHPVPAPHKKARSAFRVQSPVLPLFPSPSRQNQAQTHLRGRQLTAKRPNSLCPATLTAIPLPSQAVPSPRSLRSGPKGLAVHFTYSSGNLTHLLHSPVHPIGVTRGEMGQDSGTIYAFPEKGVMLERSQRKVWCLIQPPCTTQCQNVKAQLHCSQEYPKGNLWSCWYQKGINSRLAQCFKAPKLISHTNVHMEATLQPHQHRTYALRAQASLQALSNTQSPAPLSAGKCTGTGTSEPLEDSNWAFTFSPRVYRTISARRQLHKDGECHKGRKQQRRGCLLGLHASHSFPSGSRRKL